jgi:hypothetical protein
MVALACPRNEEPAHAHRSPSLHPSRPFSPPWLSVYGFGFGVKGLGFRV